MHFSVCVIFHKKMKNYKSGYVVRMLVEELDGVSILIFNFVPFLFNVLNYEVITFIFLI